MEINLVNKIKILLLIKLKFIQTLWHEKGNRGAVVLSPICSAPSISSEWVRTFPNFTGYVLKTLQSNKAWLSLNLGVLCIYIFFYRKMEVMKTTFKFILVTGLLEGANFFNPNKLIVIREAKIFYLRTLNSE